MREAAVTARVRPFLSRRDAGTTTEYALFLSLLVAAVAGFIISIAATTTRLTAPNARLSHMGPSISYQQPGADPPTP